MSGEAVGGSRVWGGSWRLRTVSQPPCPPPYPLPRLAGSGVRHRARLDPALRHRALADPRLPGSSLKGAVCFCLGDSRRLCLGGSRRLCLGAVGVCVWGQSASVSGGQFVCASRLDSVSFHGPASGHAPATPYLFMVLHRVVLQTRGGAAVGWHLLVAAPLAI